MHTKWAVGLVLLAGCSPRITMIGEIPDAGPPTSLTVTGRVCTERPDRNAFPVKVMLLIDQSNAACVVDPPGAQESNGFCEMVAASLPPGPSQPARVRALHRLIAGLARNPNVSVALVPFDTNVRGSFPSSGFVPATDGQLRNRVGTLQSEVGELGDLQGALEFAYTRITADADQVARTTPEVLPFTRYVVMLVSVGPPNPRCTSADTAMIFADDLNPASGSWPDSDPDTCNVNSPITGFVAGSDRNQNAQLFGLVDRLRVVQARGGLSDIRLHTVLLSNPAALAHCGAQCAGLFGVPRVRWPGPVPAPAEAIENEARFLMRELAARGDGVFTEFSNTDGLSMATFDQSRFESLFSANVLRELLPEPRMAVPFNGAWALDDDGDGVSNDEEQTATTDPQLADTDGDGFEDRFELDRRDLGFDPKVKDARGCDPSRPQTLGCQPVDTDGDGLSQFAEAFLGTNVNTSPDSDRDGFPDGLEVKFGLDPTTGLDEPVDTDGDGVTDANELRRGSHPRQADAALPVMTATWTRTTQSDDSQCYDYTITGVPMLEGWSRGAVSGVNQLKLWFDEVPERVPRAYGRWKAACSATRRDVSAVPPVLTPAGLNLTLDPNAFVAPAMLARPTDSRARCVGGTQLLLP